MSIPMGIYKRIPLAKMLKGRLLKIAELQDMVVLELSKRFDFVIHGGIAIWRVYGGKRFSRDIDIYHQNPEIIAQHFSKLFNVTKSRITPSKTLYLRLVDEAIVELQASPAFREIQVVESDFWLIDGTSIVVKTLTPENLVKEKVETFLNRGMARDLYDIYYLLDFCESGIRSELKKILPALQEPPRDFSGLRELILMGKAPSFEAIVRKVRRFAKG